MRVLFCSNLFPPSFVGGAEIVAAKQARALVELGVEVMVFAGDTRAGRRRHEVWQDEYEGLGVRRIHLTHADFDLSTSSFVNPPVEAAFLAAWDDFRPDVVHAHNLLGLSVRILVLARERGSHTVVTLHDHWGYCFKNTRMKQEGAVCRDTSKCHECMASVTDPVHGAVPMVFRRNYFRTVMASVSAFVSPSRYLADAYVASGVKEGTIEVIWNGVDTGQFDAMRREQHPSGITRFGFLGYFGRHKGVALLLEAAAIVCKSHATRIVLFGAGDQQESYLRQARALGIESILELPGKVDNREIAAAYAALDVVVLPSIWPENQPVSIVEAMAAGLPVIASRVGGVPELVLNGVTGLLFEAGDVKGLARRMSAMCDGDLRTRVGRAARSLVEDITYRDQAERLLRAYHRFCARPLSAEVLSIIPAEGDLSLPPDVPLPVDCAAGDPAAMSIPRNWLTERQQEVLEARRLRVPVPGAPLRGEDVFGTGLSPQSPQVRAGSPA